MKDRILWIDELKGFAIFLVIIGHVLISRFLPQFQLFHTVIYSFHMPLFMFLSGIFAYKALEAVDNRYMKKYIWRKIQQLLIPCISGGVLLCFFHHENYISQFLLKGGSYYWYLLSLLEFLTIFLLSYKLCKKMFMLLVLTPWIIILLIPRDSLAANLVSQANFIFTYPFFIYGYFFHKYRLVNGKTVYAKECLGNIFFLVFLICLQMFVRGDCWAYVRYGIAFSVINIVIYFYVRIVGRFKSFSIIGDIGKNSLGIYIVHYFFLGFTPFGIMTSYSPSYLTVVQYSFVIFSISIFILLLSLLTCSVIEKNKITRKILLGKQ